MESQLVQSLREKFHRRTQRLFAASPERFSRTLAQFWVFIENEPTLKGITDQLLFEHSDLSDRIEGLRQNIPYECETEKESAALGCLALKYLASSDINDVFNMARAYVRGASDVHQALNAVREVFLTPFCDYVDEKLDDQRAVLSFLYKFKHKVEWFRRDQLLDLYTKNTSKGEKILALQLYEYLHEHGIRFSIEPSSIDGAVDLISAQETDDPLLADAKVYTGDKSYICKAFGQIYSYAGKYNEVFGYLIIFNVTDHDLVFFSSSSSGNIPVITHNHKTLFVVTVDLHKHGKPPSKRGRIKPVNFVESDLFGPPAG